MDVIPNAFARFIQEEELSEDSVQIMNPRKKKKYLSDIKHTDYLAELPIIKKLVKKSAKAFKEAEHWYPDDPAHYG